MKRILCALLFLAAPARAADKITIAVPGYSRDSRTRSSVKPSGTISQSIAVMGRPIGTFTEIGLPSSSSVRPAESTPEKRWLE